MSRALRRAAPRSARRLVGRVRGEVVRAKVLGELQRIARTDRPVIAGPWLGEVGFELLYWVPFLRWALTEVGIAPERVLAVSRGGASSWYRRLASAYGDVFDVMDADEFRAANERRRHLVGEQKQLYATPVEHEIAAAVAAQAGCDDPVVLHPSLMYRVMRPYWWKHAPVSWVFRHARVEPIPPPELPASLGLAPRGYVAVKFYVNDCMSGEPWVRDRCLALVQALAREMPVISLTTELRLDDHAGTAAAGASIASVVTARNNLDVQTAVVGNARAFVGTYGGFSYLAPLCGVPAYAVYSDPGGFDPAHLTVIRSVLDGRPGPPFDVADLRTVDPTAASAKVLAA